MSDHGRIPYVTMKRFNKIYLEISNLCNLSCAFCPGTKRKKHAMTAEEFSALLRKYRLDKASEMLRETTKKVEDIGKAVGFGESAQFIRAFKKEYQLTPAQYRNEMKKTGRFTS